jgi:hypothetical protein
MGEGRLSHSSSSIRASYHHPDDRGNSRTWNFTERIEWDNAVGRTGHETFAGAACCRITELPNCKAAPLQTVGKTRSG